MKRTQTCPKCSGQQFFFVPEVHQPPDDDGWEKTPWACAVTTIYTGERRHGGDHYKIVAAKPCEAVVCAACGYIESYASPQALQTLAKMAEQGNHVRGVRGAAQPFR